MVCVKELVFKNCSAMDFCTHNLGFNAFVRGIKGKGNEDLRAIPWKAMALPKKGGISLISVEI